MEMSPVSTRHPVLRVQEIKEAFSGGAGEESGECAHWKTRVVASNSSLCQFGERTSGYSHTSILLEEPGCQERQEKHLLEPPTRAEILTTRVGDTSARRTIIIIILGLCLWTTHTQVYGSVLTCNITEITIINNVTLINK